MTTICSQTRRPIEKRRWPALQSARFWAVLSAILVCGFAVALETAPAVLDRLVTAPDLVRYCFGFGALEQAEQQPFRWSGPSWGIALFGFTHVAPVKLTIQASAPRSSDAQAATLVLDNLPSSTFTVAQEWRTYHLLAQPNVYTNEYQVIRFQTSTFTPEGSADQRSLGVAVRRFRAQQLRVPGRLSFPITPRALFFTAITLLIAAGLRRTNLPPRLTSGLVLASAVSLAGLHRYAAPALGYWLPNSWWLLGAGVLVVLATPAQHWLLRQRGGRTRSPWMLWGGAMLGGVTTLGLWLHVPVWIGLPLTVVGAGVALLALGDTSEPASVTELPQVGRGTTALLLGMTLVALALRLYRIDSLPIALWRDEVYHGQLALEIWRNPAFRPIYVPRVDLPALLFYLIAPVIGSFGPELWTVRIVPALAGALTPLALWFALRPILGMRVAVIAGWCMAVTAWGLYMSRWAFPVIFDPLFVLVAIGCTWRGLSPGARLQRSGGWLIAGGVCVGLAMYTYHTGRLAPVIVGLFVLVRLGHVRHWWRHRLALTLGFLACAATAAPLVMYAVTNPNDFNKRFEHVNLLNQSEQVAASPLATVEDNIVRYAGMWHVAGDQNARHYAPGRPMLDPVSGVLMLLGLGICLVERRAGIRALLVLWLGLGIVPGIFSDAAPHAMRSIGAYAPTCALVAMGLDALLSGGWSSRRVIAASGVLIGVLMIWNSVVYFQTTADQRTMFGAFDTTQTLIGRSARLVATVANLRPNQVYLWDASRRGVVVQFLTGDIPLGHFDGSVLTPPPQSPALLVLPGDADAKLHAAAINALGPQARVVWTGPRRPDTGVPMYMIYGSDAEAQRVVDRLSLP